MITIILNTNRREDTLACLASLERSVYPNQRTMVLDNHSADGSVEAVRRRFPQVEIIELAENLGYAGNNNVGLRAALDAGADWLFVLNEDTILDPDCISRMVQLGQAEPSAGIIGPMVYHADEPDIIQSAGGGLDRFWKSYHIGENEPDQGQFPAPRAVDWISGCAIMARRQVVERVGPFDERFFYYWEETEWCIRAARAGWRIFHQPRARLWHKGVQRDYAPSPAVTYYQTRNHLLALSKHRAPWPARLMTAAQIARTLTSWSVKPRWRHMREHRNSMWRGVVDFLRRRWGMRPT